MHQIYKSCTYPSLLFSLLLLCLPRDQAGERHRSNNSNDARARHRSRASRFGAAAGAVVGDVVPLGGDFEDGTGVWVTAVVVVDEEEVGRSAVVAWEI